MGRWQKNNAPYLVQVQVEVRLEDYHLVTRLNQHLKGEVKRLRRTDGNRNILGTIYVPLKVPGITAAELLNQQRVTRRPSILMNERTSVYGLLQRIKSKLGR